MCWLKDFVGAIGESIISRASLDPYPLPSVKAGKEYIDDLKIQETNVLNLTLVIQFVY